MTTLKSYDLNGKKLSFANWISNISPVDTPFCSMTGKESIDQVMFQWQIDTLQVAGENAVPEGATAKEGGVSTTSLKNNIAQILRKVVKVSDTSDSLENYGRGKELQYQMEKAGSEIKRDLEWAFLNNQGAQEEDPSAGIGRLTAGFHALVAPLHAVCKDTGAMVHNSTLTPALTEGDVFDLTYNLYLSGSRADIIMFHPKWAGFFASLQEKASGTRRRIFKNTTSYSFYVNTIVDPLGQEYKLIPNRWMPKNSIYFFNVRDWTQMILRAPQRTKLSKNGSYEKWMIEMEVGLRHSNPYASGILEIEPEAGFIPGHDSTDYFTEVADHKAQFQVTNSKGAISRTHDITEFSDAMSVQVGSKMHVVFATVASTAGVGLKATVLKDGIEVWSETARGGNALNHAVNPQLLLESVQMKDAGNYTIQIHRPDKGYCTTSAFMMDVYNEGNHAGA